MKTIFLSICLMFFQISTGLLGQDADTIRVSTTTAIDTTKNGMVDSSTQEQGEAFPEDLEAQYMEIKGKVYPVLITETDTFVLAMIDEVSFSTPRTFANKEDRQRYRKYRAYASKVYPYALEAIRLFRELEYAQENMPKKQRKKYIKSLEKRYEEEFEAPLKKLSKTQGKILVKMIERELETPMYELIKGIKGRFVAFYWNQSSKLYGYRLKNGYVIGENPILDVVLQDFDISYERDPSYSEFNPWHQKDL